MKVHKIEAGTFHCDGGAVFGVVPKRVWQKRYPCNEDNFCTLAMRCLLIDTGEKRIIIDTGAGNKQEEYLKYYDLNGIIDFETALNKLEYTCRDITDVILTHLHFDHCGGCTYYKDTFNREIALTFPNADHWVGEEQWNNFLHPNVREADSYFMENIFPLEEAGKLRLVRENQQICPEVELRLYGGHTVGQIAVYVYDVDRTIVYVGDIIPVSAAIPLAWVSAFDTYPITSMDEKKRLLDEAVERRQLLFFEHDAYTECCTVKCINGKYRIADHCNI